MAGAVPKQSTSNAARERTRVSPFPHLAASRWLPALLLALATVVSIIAAYAVRPAVSVDLGDYYDTPFLPNTRDRELANADFYAREVGAIGPEQPFDWPAGQETLDLPGHRQGVWQLSVYAVENQPADPLTGLTVSVNGVRLWLPRDVDRQIVGIVPPELAAAETWHIRLEPGLAGDPDPPPGLAARVTVAPARTYRWSSGESTIQLPGLGRGDWMITLTAILQHPDNQPLDATVFANGSPVATLPDGGLRRLSLLVPGELVPDGDLTLTIKANTFKDPRELGLLLYDVKVAPAGTRTFLPPLKYLLYALTIALSLYVCLFRMTRGNRLSAVLALLAILAGAWALATARYPTAFMLPRLAVLALWSVVLLLVLERLVAWAFRAAGVPLSDWTLRALLLIFFVGYWIKAGGMLYPYFVGIDMRLQLSWARRIWSGEFWTFYGTDNPMNERTMPTAEWGATRPVIPYSPWFHIFAGLFWIAPMPAVLAGHMFSALVDVSRVFLIALLGRKLSLSERSTVLASLLYAVTPVTFMLHSWGNLPTMFGIWWTLVCTVFVVAAYRRLDRPGPFIILTLLLTATMLIYTVMAVFMMLFLGLLLVVLWFVKGKTADTSSGSAFVSGEPNNRRVLIAIALAALASIGLSTLIYYGQYIPLMIERTLPYFFDRSEGQTVGIQNHQPFLAYLGEYWPRFGYFVRPVMYGIQLLVLLGVLGLFAVRKRRVLALFLCWTAIALLFVVAGSRISMVDKQIFYLIPALCLLAAPLLSRLWSRGLPARLVVASVYAFTFITALDFWLFRIVTTRQ